MSPLGSFDCPVFTGVSYGAAGRACRVIRRRPGAIGKIDLPNQTLTTPSGRVVEFPVDAFSKHCLVKGVDELGYILEQAPEIGAYEATHPAPINALG